MCCVHGIAWKLAGQSSDVCVCPSATSLVKLQVLHEFCGIALWYNPVLHVPICHPADHVGLHCYRS
jgi:hypothetical protein